MSLFLRPKQPCLQTTCVIMIPVFKSHQESMSNSKQDFKVAKLWYRDDSYEQLS